MNLQKLIAELGEGVLMEATHDELDHLVTVVHREDFTLTELLAIAAVFRSAAARLDRGVPVRSFRPVVVS